MDRDLHASKPEPRNLRLNFRGVGRAVLMKRHSLQRLAGERAEAVVSVGEIKTCGETRQRSRQSEDGAADGGHGDRVLGPEEPRSERDVRRAVGQWPDQYGNVLGLMLPVGIESDDKVCRPGLEEKGKPRAERRALAKVDAVPQNQSTGGRGVIRRVIVRSVIDNQDPPLVVPKAPDHVVNHPALAIGRKNDPCPREYLRPAGHDGQVHVGQMGGAM